VKERKKEREENFAGYIGLFGGLYGAFLMT